MNPDTKMILDELRKNDAKWEQRLSDLDAKWDRQISEAGVRMEEQISTLEKTSEKAIKWKIASTPSRRWPHPMRIGSHRWREHWMM
jgi:hypothetical protein